MVDLLNYHQTDSIISGIKLRRLSDGACSYCLFVSQVATELTFPDDLAETSLVSFYFWPTLV